MNIETNTPYSQTTRQSTVKTRNENSRFLKLYAEYLDLKQNIDILQEKILLLKEITEYKSPSLVGGGGGKNTCADKIGKNAAKIVDLKRELGEKEVRMLELWEIIADRVCSLDNPTQRRIMTERYINRKRWDTIAKDINLSERWIFRLHKKALEILG